MLAGAKPKIDFSIYNIKLMMDISDPDKQGTPIPFTKSMLHDPTLKDINMSRFSEYPYITGNVKYDDGYLKRQPYNRRVQFFFDKSKFKKWLNEYHNGYAVEEIDENIDTINDNLKNNVDIMMKLLFPTVYPVVENYQNSFDTKIMRESSSMFNVTAKGAIPFGLSGLVPSLSVFYSYLKIDGKVYTITKIIWLNDMINHPVYKDLLNKYKDFKKWLKKTKSKNAKDIKERKTKIFSAIVKQQGKPLIETNPKLVKIIRNLLAVMDLKEGTYDKNISTLNLTTIFNANNDNKSQRFILGKKLILAICELYLINLDDANELVKRIEFGNEDENDIITKIRQLYDLYKKQNVDRYNSRILSIPTELETMINQLNESTEKIRIIEVIDEKYFEGDGDNININLNFEDDAEDVKRLFQSEYKKYTEFVDEIRKLIKPNLESSNANLQDLLYKYTQGTSNDFTAILDGVNKAVSSSDSTTISLGQKKPDILYIGLNTTETTSKESPKYTAYFNVDVIKGELNDANKSKVKCSFEGEYIGEMYQKLAHSTGISRWEVDAKRLFFDIEKDGPDAKKKVMEEEVKSLKKPIQDVKPPPAIPVEPEKNKAQGGKKYKTYKYYGKRRNSLRTRRIL